MTHEEALARLAQCRREIDEIDRRILALLNARTRAVEIIGAVKRQFSMPVYEPKREDEVYRNVLDHNQGPLPAESVRRIFERVIDEMRMLQRLKADRQ